MPSIGRVRIRQSLATELPTKSATFKRTAVGRWFVTVVVKFAMPAAKAPIREEQAVGYDMVLEPPNFLVRSDGEEVLLVQREMESGRSLLGSISPFRGPQFGRHRPMYVAGQASVLKLQLV